MGQYKAWKELFANLRDGESFSTLRKIVQRTGVFFADLWDGTKQGKSHLLSYDAVNRLW
jgi:hypothetical protein